MANLTPSHIRGFIAPYRFTSSNFWEAQSTLGQGPAMSGIPSPQQRSSLTLTTSGTQSTKIDVKTHRAGHVLDGAGFTWKYSTDTLYYGYEPPNKITDIRTVQTRNPIVTERYYVRDTIRLTSGVVLLAIEHDLTSSASNRVRVGILGIDGTYSDVLVSTVSTTKLLGEYRYPTLCEMPDGSILLAMYAIDPIEYFANVHIYRSTDSGYTWSLVSDRAIEDDIDISSAFGAGAVGYDLSRITLAASDSQTLLLLQVYNHNTSLTIATQMIQYASSSGGLVYKHIDTSGTGGSASHFYLPDVVVHNNVFIFSYISSTDSISFTRITNAYDSIFSTLGLIPADVMSGLFANTTANRLIDGNKTMFIDTDGRLHLYATTPDTTQTNAAYSDLQGISVADYGSTWIKYGIGGIWNNARVLDLRSPAPALNGGISSIFGVARQGQNLIFCNYTSAGTNLQKDGIHMLSFGAWSTQQYARLQRFVHDNEWGYNTQDYIPVDLPDQGGVWSKLVSGTPTSTLQGDRISLSCTGTQTVKYYEGVSNKTNGVLLHTKIKNITGGTSTQGTAFGVRIAQPGSTDSYAIEIVLTATALYVYDLNVGYGSTLHSVTGLSYTQGIQIILHLNNSTGDYHIYYGEASSVKKYTRITGTVSLLNVPTQQIYWGIPTQNGATRSADYSFFSYALGERVGIEWTDAVINAHQYSGQGYYTDITGGLLLSTLDGPARIGDTYSISPQYTYPITRTLHTVSPTTEIGWRSDSVLSPDTTNVAQQQIAWMLDTTLAGTANTRITGGLLGISLHGINFGFFSVQTYDSATGWSAGTTITNNVGGGFNFTRLGAAIYSGKATGPYLHLNECQGWSILLDDKAGTVVQRRIRSNGDGVLANTSSKKAYIHIEGVKSTDPTSGTATLIPDSCTAILNLQSFAGIRISIPAQRTKEGYFEIGTMVVGDVVIPAHQYSRGRTISFDANVIESNTPNGITYATKKGNGTRTVRIAWTEGVDVSDLFATSASPHYYSVSGSVVAAYGSAPTSMMGLVEYCSGSLDAVVYLPSVSTSTTPVTLNRYYEHMLCTFGLDIQIDHVLGDELQSTSGEVFRVSTVVLKEVV